MPGQVTHEVGHPSKLCMHCTSQAHHDSVCPLMHTATCCSVAPSPPRRPSAPLAWQPAPAQRILHSAPAPGAPAAPCWSGRTDPEHGVLTGTCLTAWYWRPRQLLPGIAAGCRPAEARHGRVCSLRACGARGRLLRHTRQSNIHGCAVLASTSSPAMLAKWLHTLP